MFLKVSYKGERAVLKRLAYSRKEVKQLRIQKKLTEQKIHYHASDLSEPVTKLVIETNGFFPRNPTLQLQPLKFLI